MPELVLQMHVCNIFNVPSLQLFAHSIITVLALPIRESVTYNWPCANTGVGKYGPIVRRVCPCDLWIIMQYVSLMGN